MSFKTTNNSFMKTHINTLGIILTTLGAYLVWRYLTDLPFIDRKAFMSGDSVATVPASTSETRRKFGRQILLSQVGLGLIVLGGFIQIVSNYWPD